MVKKLSKEKADELKNELKDLMKKADYKVYATVKRVAPSGMSRHIDLNIFYVNKEGKVQRYWITPAVGELLGYTRDKQTEALRVSGCGMDMCFHVVYSLSMALYGFEDRGGYKLEYIYL